MDDFARMYFQLSLTDPIVHTYTILVLIFGALGLIAPILINIYFDFKHSKGSAVEEEDLTNQYNLLFRMKMEFDKQGEPTDFERDRLLAISERLDEIRAIKTRHY